MYSYNDDDILTVNEVMDILKISKNVALKLLQNGSIKAFRINRKWKIPRELLGEFIIESAKNKCRYYIDTK